MVKIIASFCYALFLGKPEFLKFTLIVVEFFSNLPQETEIGSKAMRAIRADRVDIWLWIHRQFDVVAKADHYVLAHKQKQHE